MFPISYLAFVKEAKQRFCVFLTERLRRQMRNSPLSFRNNPVFDKPDRRQAALGMNPSQESDRINPRI